MMATTPVEEDDPEGGVITRGRLTWEAGVWPEPRCLPALEPRPMPNERLPQEACLPCLLDTWACGPGLFPAASAQSSASANQEFIRCPWRQEGSAPAALDGSQGMPTSIISRHTLTTGTHFGFVM